MAAYLSFLLILTALTGIQSLRTVSKVSVRLGESISVPCLYNPCYVNHVKYLCKGSPWISCTYEVKTNAPRKSEKFSISDDKRQRIFTVTIKDLTKADTYYWCIVEINNGADVGEKFQLSAIESTKSPRLFVTHQYIVGFIGDKITIHCQTNVWGNSMWCKLGGSCVKSQPGSIEGTEVIINTNASGFTVTMNGLKSSGWYYCDKGGFQMPVHITVNEKPTTTTLASIGPTTVQAARQSASVFVKSLAIILTLLILIAMVALFIWFMVKKYKQTEAEPSAMTVRPNAVSGTNEVVYASGVIRQQHLPRVEADDEDVTYSTVIYSQQ